ncbi:hypothetical protein [Planomonospora sp. ID82291]|uniref:hypothetical protein n=1 Tax=Planomonospora sp. ID82291 TaxID=2738136 RepID=UPI0018C3FCBF|nr:hypothetical protein [Planomonospora sp. ID82291]MBG0816546.1 hypothetical protein [Planomonospora sp. ID82291]
MTDTLSIILLTALFAALVIGLILLAVRLAQRPRNALLGSTLSPELVEQVRELKSTGELDQAVFIVRGETGMSHRAASRFVKKIR